MSLKKHLEQFANDTSMHGFGKMVLSKKPEKRVAWTIIFFLAWALFAYQLYSVLSSYFKYSKKTITQFDSGGAPFPAITLCNMQGIDSYVAHIFHTSYFEFDWDSSNETFAEFMGRNNNKLAFEIAKFDELFMDLEIENTKTFNKLNSRTTLISNVGADALEEGSLSEEEFIVKCSFSSSKCNFTHFLHPYYLKCFTFEPPTTKDENTGEYLSLSEGILNGLSVTIFTGTKIMDSSKFQVVFVPGINERYSPLSGTAGIRLVIHPPGTEPFPLTEGFDIPTGYQASIGINPKRYKRLGRPYGQCDKNNKYHLKDLNQAESDKSESYRKVSCERTCIQERVIEKCKCFDNSLPNPGNLGLKCVDDTCWRVGGKVNDSRLKDHQDNNQKVIDYGDLNSSRLESCNSLRFLNSCRIKNDQNCTNDAVEQFAIRMRCVENVTNAMMTNVKLLATCKCYPPCDEFRYETSYSLSRWPPAGYEVGAVYYDIFGIENKFLDRFKNEKKKEHYETYTKQKGINAMDDFAKINVYVEDSNVLETVEEPAMTLTQCISDIGGQLGLWIGVSVITISEILETILKLIISGFRKLFGKSQSKEEEEKNVQSVNSEQDI